MRNKLKRQEAVVFPVKANGTKNMAGAFKIFFPSLFLLGFRNAWRREEDCCSWWDHEVLTVTLAPSPGRRAWLHFC